MAKDGSLLKKIKNQVETATAANKENMVLYRACQRFMLSKEGQWTIPESKYFGEHNKPSIVANRMYVGYKKTIGAQRNLKRSPEIRAIGGNPDDQQDDKLLQKKVDLLEDIIQSISFHSNANKIYEDAFASSWFGVGGWRIKADYESDKSFNQCLKLVELPLPENIYWDPYATDTGKTNGNYMGYSTYLDASDIKNQYNVDVKDAKNRLVPINNDKFPWILNSGGDDEKYCVCHHFIKKPVQKKIALLSNGTQSQVCKLNEVDEKLKELNDPIIMQMMSQPQQPGQPPMEKPPLYEFVDERTVATHKIQEVIFCGKKVLDKQDWLGKSFPICLVFSDGYLDEDGRYKVIPVSYFGQDIQKMNNIVLSGIADSITRYRKERIIVQKENIPSDSDMQEAWANASEYEGIMYFKPTVAFPRPEILDNQEIPQSLLATLPIINAIYNDVNGRSPSSQMDPSNSSGVAIDNVVNEDNSIDLLSYDNLNRAIEYSANVLLECIPYIYDSYRKININSSNGNKNVIINDPNNPETQIDAEQDYEITVHTGPAFEVQKKQTADAIMNLVQADPQMLSLAGDILVKNLNVNDTEEIAERMYYAMDPRILKSIGVELPLSPPPAPPPPPPEAILMAQLKQKELQLKSVEIQNKMQIETQKLQQDSQNNQQVNALTQQKQQIDYELAQLQGEIEGMKLQSQQYKDQLGVQTAMIKARAEVVKQAETSHAAIHTARIKGNDRKNQSR